VKSNPGLPWQKQHSTVRNIFHQRIRLKVKEGTSKILLCSIALYGVETCWRRMEKISWADRVRKKNYSRIRSVKTQLIYCQL